MRGRWRSPGKAGAVLYAVLAVIVGSVLAFFSRLQLERQRGRRRMVEELPAGALIVISNHTSYADGLLLALACRRMGRSLRLLATSGVFRAPVIGTLARRLGFISVERGSERASTAVDRAAEALAAGEAVGIFPEGRLTRHPERWPERAKTGTVRLALRTGAPIVPVAMEGAHRVVGRSRIVSTIVANVFRRPVVRVKVGEPIDVCGLAGLPAGSDASPEQVRELADAVMTRLVALVAEMRGEAPPDPAGVERVDGS
ncbi:MAG TPA: lysophospholipid acyltransferase family protein [Acidimicrobiales bacterium]